MGAQEEKNRKAREQKNSFRNDKEQSSFPSPADAEGTQRGVRVKMAQAGKEVIQQLHWK